MVESEYISIDGNLRIVESTSKYREGVKSYFLISQIFIFQILTLKRHENKRRALERIEELAAKGESGLIRGMTVRKNGYHKRSEAREKSRSTFQSQYARLWCQ